MQLKWNELAWKVWKSCTEIAVTVTEVLIMFSGGSVYWSKVDMRLVRVIAVYIKSISNAKTRLQSNAETFVQLFNLLVWEIEMNLFIVQSWTRASAPLYKVLSCEDETIINSDYCTCNTPQSCPCYDLLPPIISHATVLLLPVSLLQHYSTCNFDTCKYQENYINLCCDIQCRQSSDQ